MPATGKNIGAWLGTPMRSTRNVRFGKSYMACLKAQSAGQPAQATVSAASNAGSHQMRRWLPGRTISTDVCVEVISVGETRGYVTASTEDLYRRQGDHEGTHRPFPRQLAARQGTYAKQGHDPMSRTVYVDCAFVPEHEAKVSVFDRAFLFADGVYEVLAVLDGRLVDNAAHLVRLGRSLKALGISPPATDEQIEAIQRELIDRSGLYEGVVYLQVTRGSADRDFAYPSGVAPTMVMFTQSKSLASSPQAERGISVITTQDVRWARRDIKTVCLLAASLAKQAALDAGADDAWMVEDGHVTEGSSNNAYIVTVDGTIVTRHLGTEILPGITRAAVLELAQCKGLAIEERPFTPEEAYRAREAFSTSASSFVMPVVEIDGNVIGNGHPGTVSRELRELYLRHARAAADGK